MRDPFVPAALACLLSLSAAAAPADDFASRLASAGLEFKASASRVHARRALTAEAAAQPPAARDFPLSRGTWKTRVAWSSDPATGEDVLSGHLAFWPDAKACPACKSIRLIQTARVETAPGRDLDWRDGQENRNKLRSPGGYFIDHNALPCREGRPCSPYYRDSWPLPDESQDGANFSGTASPASLADYPFGWTSFQRITLETCARCVDTGEFLGCAVWGGDWPQTGDRTLLPLGASEKPSADFLGALAAFESFYRPAPLGTAQK